jgi:hypothetical protein
VRVVDAFAVIDRGGGNINAAIIMLDARQEGRQLYLRSGGDAGGGSSDTLSRVGNS